MKDMLTFAKLANVKPSYDPQKHFAKKNGKHTRCCCPSNFHTKFDGMTMECPWNVNVITSIPWHCRYLSVFSVFSTKPLHMDKNKYLIHIRTPEHA